MKVENHKVYNAKAMEFPAFLEEKWFSLSIPFPRMAWGR